MHGITFGDHHTVVISSWNMVEVHVAVICACLVTIKPLLIRLFPRAFSPPTQTDDGDRTGENEIETIGRARQRRRRDPLDSDMLTTTGKESGQSSMAVESVGMVDLEVAKEGGEPASNGLNPRDTGKAGVRLEKSYDSLGRPEVSGHSIL